MFSELKEFLTKDFFIGLCAENGLLVSLFYYFLMFVLLFIFGIFFLPILPFYLINHFSKKYFQSKVYDNDE